MRTVRRLIRALRDEDEEVRAEAADRLGEMGPAADAAIPALVAALGDNDPSVRCRVALALDRVGVGAGEAGLAVEGALRDEDGEVRAVAARLLIARQAGDCIAEAVETLAEVPPEAGSPDHRLLIEALQDDRPEVSWAAAPGLAGARPRPGGPSTIDLDDETAAGLEKLLGEVEAIVRVAAGKTLVLGGRSVDLAFTAIFACLLGNDEAEAAGRAIADLTAAPGLLPADLRPIASDLTEWDDGVVVDAVGIVGVPHGPAFAAVVGAMRWGLARDHYRNFRHDVIGALGRTGPSEPSLIEILAKIVWDGDAPEVDLEEAISLLEDLSRTSRPALLTLLDVFLDNRLRLPNVRSWEVYRIARTLIGAEDACYRGAILERATVSALIAALADSRQEGLHRAAAERVLRGIDALGCGELAELTAAFGALAGDDPPVAVFASLSVAASRHARPALLEALWEAEPAVVLNTAVVLDAIELGLALPTLLSRLKAGEGFGPGRLDGDIDGTPAATALGRLGAAEAVPALAPAARRGHPPTRIEAIRALTLIAGAGAVSLLLDLLAGRAGTEGRFQDIPVSLHEAIAECLGSLGPAAHPAAPALEQLLAEGPDAAATPAIRAALGRIRGVGPTPASDSPSAPSHGDEGADGTAR